MARVQYKFGKPYLNVATEGNILSVASATNVYYEAMPEGGFVIRKRPGLTYINQATGTPQTARGLYCTNSVSSNNYVVVGKTVSTLSGASAVSAAGDLISATSLSCIFAEGLNVSGTRYIMVTDNQHLAYITGTTVATAASGAPAASTTVACMNNRFWVNDTSAPLDIYVSGVNPSLVPPDLDPTYFAIAENPFRAIQRAGRVLRIENVYNEMYIFKEDLTEVWQEDGVNPISPLIGSSIEAGLEAVYSVVRTDNTLFALVNIQGKKAVVRFSGRNPQIVSEPIAQTLAGYTTTDAIGSVTYAGGVTIYLLHFPTSNATWAYDVKSDCWSQWASYTSGTTDGKFIGVYNAYDRSLDRHLSLDTSGNLYKYDRAVYQDGASATKVFTSEIVTGWLDHGTSKLKRCDKVTVRVRGGLASNSDILLYYRDDGNATWSSAISIPIDSTNQNNMFAEVNRLGIYRNRQYKIVMTDGIDLALVGFDEDLTELGH